MFMLPFKLHSLARIGLVVSFGLALILGSGLLYVAAAPPSQFPINSVTLISDPPPPDPNFPGQFVERTILQNNLLDPGGTTQWRFPTFDDSSWLNSYPVVRLPAWGDPLGNPASPADFIWGGSPGVGPDANGRYQIPNTPNPRQYLFLRKNFCIPINASLNSVAVVNPLRLQVAASPGNASVYYNGTALVTGLPGDETGAFYNLNLLPGLVNSVRRIGRNTLAMRVRDDLADTSAGVAYQLQFNYNIDPAALTINSNPPSPTTANTAITFSQNNNGLSGDGPFTFEWNFGDGTTSTAAAPVKAYATPGTYTVVLTMTDRFGCPSAPVSLIYEVQPQPTATPTNTPIAPPPSSDDDDDDVLPTPTATATPTPTPTATPAGPVYLPETGLLAEPASPHSSPLVFTVGIISLALLGAGYLARRWLKSGD